MDDGDNNFYTSEILKKSRYQQKPQNSSKTNNHTVNTQSQEGKRFSVSLKILLLLNSPTFLRLASSYHPHWFYTRSSQLNISRHFFRKLSNTYKHSQTQQEASRAWSFLKAPWLGTIHLLFFLKPPTSLPSLPIRHSSPNTISKPLPSLKSHILLSFTQKPRLLISTSSSNCVQTVVWDVPGTRVFGSTYSALHFVSS